MKTDSQMKYPDLTMQPIGIIRTPYSDSAPYQPVETDDQAFSLELEECYCDGLRDLDAFKWIYVIYHLHRQTKPLTMEVSPPWAQGKWVGLFASRSPVRPNPIGLSVVQIKSIDGNRIETSGLDVFDGTPLLDIKPYIHDLDVKADATNGWIDGLEAKEHLQRHLKGLPHEH